MDKKEILVRIKSLIVGRVNKLEDLPKWTRYLFIDNLDYEDNLLLSGKLSTNKVINILDDVNSYLRFHQSGSFEEFARTTLVSKYSTKLTNVLWPIRIAITGQRVALPLFESMQIIGNERCIQRISIAINKLKENQDA